MTIDKNPTTAKAKKLLPQKGASFAQNLLRIFLLAMIVCAVFLLAITLYLTDYQRSLPADAAAKLLKAYEETNSAVFSQYSDALPNAFADDYRFAAYIDLSFPKENLYYCKGTAKNAGETAYEFKAGNMHIATLTTKEIKSTTFFGFQNYEVVSFVPHPLIHYNVFAPLGTPLMLEGAMLHEKYPPQPAYAKACFKDVSASNISEVYSIPDYDALGALSVKDARAEDYIIDIDKENHSVMVTSQAEQTSKAEIIDFTGKFVKEYLLFTSKKNADRWAVLKMTHPKTEFHKTLQQYSNTWGKEYTSDRFKDVIIDEIKKYSQTEYSCRVSLTYTIVRSEGVTKNTDFSAVLYLTNKTGKWLTVDMAL